MERLEFHREFASGWAYNFQSSVLKCLRDSIQNSSISVCVQRAFQKFETDDLIASRAEQTLA